jgi:DNA-binding transcriptional ArsR family regulator
MTHPTTTQEILRELLKRPETSRTQILEALPPLECDLGYQHRTRRAVLSALHRLRRDGKVESRRDGITALYRLTK